ncbi:MAG TPA: Rrf2 family transcriptional regulator [Chitinophagaceae bacterium]|jgi:Rrf2 family protein|nr:Rrf2 family transcriptional regulator [Chitinophagaceae bacterium]
MFSKTCEYGLRACVFIAIGSEQGGKLGIQEIAKAIESPMYFTGKILQNLVKAKLISSAKGPNGGFYLSADAKPIPVIRILEVLGCDAFFKNCALGLSHCSDKHPCPIHEEFKPYREGLLELLKRTTVQQLAAEIREGKGHITNMDIAAREGRRRKAVSVSGKT